jgi:VWFA-related protein
MKRILVSVLLPMLTAVYVLSVETAATQQQTKEVAILFSATDKYDRVITRFRASDLKVFEDGKLRPIAKVEEAEDLPLFMEVLIDTSASMRDQPKNLPEMAKLFLRSVIRPGKDRASVASFAQSPAVEEFTTNDLSPLFAAIDRISQRPPYGKTALYQSVIDAAKRLGRSPGRRIILTVSDGIDNVNVRQRSTMVESLQQNDVAIYAVCCYRRHNSILPTLEPTNGEPSIPWTIASETGGLAYFPTYPQNGDAERDFRLIARLIASQHMLHFQPDPSGRAKGLHKIRIESTTPDLKDANFRYRQRY